MRYWRLLILLPCLWNWSGCAPSAPRVIVLPDSHQLRPAYNADGTLDPLRVTMDKGYLRELMDCLTIDKGAVPAQ